MKDRFSEAVNEMEEKSAFDCVTCEDHEIGKGTQEPATGYDINDGLERLRRDPSPSGA